MFTITLPATFTESNSEKLDAWGVPYTIGVSGGIIVGCSYKKPYDQEGEQYYIATPYTNVVMSVYSGVGIVGAEYIDPVTKNGIRPGDTVRPKWMTSDKADEYVLSVGPRERPEWGEALLLRRGGCTGGAEAEDYRKV